MTVETVGAQGFDYQYTATLYMILKYLEMDNFKAWVENESFEDAKLSYQLENKMYQIELQVKNRSRAISYDEFAGWLAHFQKRKSDYFILDKIQESDTNFFVIVTNNRCTDDVSKFLGNESEIKENGIHFSKEKLEDLKKRILMRIDDRTQLGKERKKHVKQYFAEKNANELNKVFRRVCVIERKEQIETDICMFLKKQYQIPEFICKDVMNQMLDTIRKGRDSGENIVISIKEIIKNKKFTRVLPEDNKFYKRDSIDMLKNELLQKHVLLLTGLPFSGKTYMAKTIAQELQEEGYYVKRADNIIDDQEAYYFFVSPENDSRLLLLEDPFGHIRKKDEYMDILDKIRELVREKISINRKIIVTSRIDVLFDVFKKSEIESCKIVGNKWNNTSITDIQEAKKIWQLFYGKSKESFRVFERLSSHFDHYKESVFLEIGEIRHLFIEETDIHKLKDMSTNEIIKMARISSGEVCQKIESYGEDYKDIFILMGCFCDTIRTINIKDLAYILCSHEEPVSIRKKNQEKVTITTRRSQKSLNTNNVFPEYSQIIELDKNIKNILRDLCEKGYIYKDRNTKEFYFLHPVYSYASKLLLEKEINEDWDINKYIEYMNRAIGSLSPNAAVCSLYRLEQEFELSQVIIDCVVKGSMSIFPVVRDASILFLDRNFDALSEQVQKDFMINIKNSRIADEYIQWNCGECWYQIDGNHYYDCYTDYLNDYLGKDITITLNDIENRMQKEKNFSKKEIYEIMSSRLVDNLSQKFLEYALLSDEAIIRSKAVYYLFKNYAVKLDFEKAEYLNNFESYNVVYNMLKGMFHSIESFSDENIKLLISYFQKQFARKSISMYVENLFDKFGDEYESKAIDWKKHNKYKLKVWKVWASLFSKWLICFPVKFMKMHESHLCLNVERSLKYLKNQQEVVDIANAWLQWINNYLHYHSVSDYGMSVLNYLIIGTANANNLRKGILVKELGVNNTSLVTSHISHIVDLWDMLTNEEKSAICKYLSDESRSDIKWIQAVALTRKKVPKEIQIAITGTIFLDKKIEQIIDILNDKKVLTECLHVFCGFPQPLWFNGYHHAGECLLWDGVMMEILKKPVSKECYNISLREFINVLYNRECRFINGYSLYQKMLCDNENRKQIFNRLAYTSVTQNQENKKLWDCLFLKCSDEEKAQFFSMISSFIEMVEQKNIGYNGLLCEYEFKDVVNYILPYFSSDKEIYELSCSILNIYKMNWKIEKDLVIEDEFEIIKSVIEVYEKKVEEIYEKTPPRLLFTNTIVECVCNEFGMQSDVIQKTLKKSKDDFWDRYDKIKEEFEKDCPLKIKDEFRLENWNDYICEGKGESDIRA